MNNTNNKNHTLHIIPLFSLVAVSILGFMGTLALYNQSFVLASCLFIASFICFIGYYTNKKFNNAKLASAFVLYSLYGLMFYLVYTGGVDQTGPLWIFIIAPLSVFIHGLKRGLIDLTFFVIVISYIMFIPIDILAHIEYSTEFKLRILYSFLTVTALSAVYEYSREKSYKHALDLSKKYQQLANLDTLTQLSNRRDALYILTKERARLLRSKEPLSIVLCDVDYFKKINDRYGHNGGDAVLIALAKLFKDTIREQDYVARWGGEEFLFILPKTDADNANVLAEKLQDNLNRNPINYNKSQINVTLSMGIEQFDSNQSIDEVINKADKYLYQAKHSGRNQIFPKFDSVSNIISIAP
jgi:diguanylate cyclase (GGDEF)-like protein